MYVIMGATSNIGSKLANILLDKARRLKSSAERLKAFGDRGAEAAVWRCCRCGIFNKCLNCSVKPL